MTAAYFYIMKKLFLFSLAAALLIGFTSCSKDDDDLTEGNPTGSNDEAPPSDGLWYANTLATPEDFKEINEAIENHELLSDYGKYGMHYAEPEEFFNEVGAYSTSDASFGRLRFLPGSQMCSFIHVRPDNTLDVYSSLFLFKYEKAVGTRFYTVDAGRLGKLSYAVYPGESYPYTTYTYVEIDGKYVCDNGDIYIKRGNTLVKSGESISYTLFEMGGSSQAYEWDKPDGGGNDDAHKGKPERGALILNGAVITEIGNVDDKDDGYVYTYDPNGVLLSCREKDRIFGKEYVIDYNENKIYYTDNSLGGRSKAMDARFNSLGLLTYLRECVNEELGGYRTWSLSYDNDCQLIKIEYDQIFSEEPGGDDHEVTIFEWSNGLLLSKYTENSKRTIEYSHADNVFRQFNMNFFGSISSNEEHFQILMPVGVLGKAPVKMVKSVTGYYGIFTPDITCWSDGRFCSEILGRGTFEYSYSYINN